MYSYLLLIILIILIYCMIKVDNNLYLIMFSFLFSLITASIYFIYKAPDLALAEVAIGCGLTPLIYIIAIAKQKTFIVVFFRGVGKGELKDTDLELEFTNLLDEFADHYSLKLKVYDYKSNYRPSRKKSLNLGHIDMIAMYDGKEDIIKLEGNKYNLMINRLQYIVSSYNRIILKKDGDYNA